jgi:hypothetical protein
MSFYLKARRWLFAAAAFCSAPTFAITGTQWVDDHEHPFVGLLVVYDAKGEFAGRCSGSLIDARTFVTAGHCVVDDDAKLLASARVYFQQDAGVNFDPVTEIDPVTGYPETCAPGTLGSLCATSSSLHNYGFNNFAGFPNTKDVAVVILDQPIHLDEYGQLPAAGALDRLGRGAKDTLFTVSGYGLTKRTNVHSPLPNTSFRERLMARSTLVNLNSAQNGGFNVQTQGNGNDRGGTCSGDSGGPVFLGGFAANTIVAVTSFGLNELCRGTDFAYRLDRADVIDWINALRP